jgi:flagellar biosynthetic protein FliR
MDSMKELIGAIGYRGEVSNLIVIGTLIVIRAVAIVFQVPFLGGKLVPPETRIGLAFGLAILVYPYAVGSMVGPMDMNPIVYVVLMLKELFVGFVIGFIASELFYAMEVAGRSLDIMRGSNMAEVQVPELQLRASPIGEFNFQLLLIVFCALNGHGHFIESVAESYRIVPLDGWPSLGAHNLEDMTTEILKYTSGLFALAFALVFPGLFSAFVVDIVFGMFNRIAPQLNAYFMAMGIKAMAGIAMFMFTLSMLLGQLAERLEDSLIFLRRIIHMMG